MGEQNVVRDLRDRWQALTGYMYALNDGDLYNLAHSHAATLADVSKYIVSASGTNEGPSGIFTQQPWALYGLAKDSYVGLATTYGTEFKKLTGQDISSDALQSAFTKVKDPTGAGFLSGSQYAQQLQSDTNMQNTYGWLKYGMDYSQFQQHKLGMTAAFGGTPTDAQATQALSYWHQNASATAEVRAQTQTPGQQQKAPSPGEAQSVIR